MGLSDCERGIDSIALSVDCGSLIAEEPVSLLEARSRKDLRPKKMLHLARS